MGLSSRRYLPVNFFDFQPVHIFQSKERVHKLDIAVYLLYSDLQNCKRLIQGEERNRAADTNRLEEVLEENRKLRIVAADFGCVKVVVGSEQVNAVINRVKQQEKIEVEQKGGARRKHNRDAR